MIQTPSSSAAEIRRRRECAFMRGEDSLWTTPARKPRVGYLFPCPTLGAWRAPLARSQTASARNRRLPSAFSLPRYLAALALLFASASRSVFLRRAARFLTLSLPLQCPIGREHTRFARACQAVSLQRANHERTKDTKEIELRRS